LKDGKLAEYVNERYNSENPYTVVDTEGMYGDQEEAADEFELEFEHADVHTSSLSGSTEDETNVDSEDKAEEDDLEFRSSTRLETTEPSFKDRVPKQYHTHWSKGGWFNRLPRVDPTTIKPPRGGSLRPPDIETYVWAEAGPGANYELKTRAKEDAGEAPPTLPKPVLDKLKVDEFRGVTEAGTRHAELTQEMLIKMEAENVPNLMAAASVGSSCRVYGSEGSTPTDAHQAAWPEGDAAWNSLREWCQEEGVPGPNKDLGGHRTKKHVNELLGFGLVVRPIPIKSPEGQTDKARAAVQKEVDGHESRGTWDVKRVIEKRDLFKKLRQTGEEVELGTVHPILGAKVRRLASRALARPGRTRL